jgi:hypothetical protein
MMHRTSTCLTAALFVWLGGSPIALADDPPLAAPQKKTAQTEAGEPRATTRPAEKADKADKAVDNRTDRVDLDTTTVTGNRELPKVLYVVPWKKADIGDFVGKPMNSLLDEVLAPVDRDVFRREVGYYQALHAQAGQNSAAPSPQAEK